eukprot:maker-scaffold244_size240795-snap-gene-0.18 protein:Tk02090 transcript:maker-scaffold244_size240795-snap-gene-0.18-mRNA-1 annotation:"hypothetical protein L798_12768"
MRSRLAPRRPFRSGGPPVPVGSSLLTGAGARPGSSSGHADLAPPATTPGYPTYQAALMGHEKVGAALNVHPVHLPLPALSVDAQIVFELIIFTYSMVAMMLQHLHLYRSVFWLPHSYNSEALNWYLIEWNIIYFACIFLGRRILWLGIKSLIMLVTPTPWTASFIIVARSLTSLSILVSLFYIIYVILLKYPLVNLFGLVYPVLLYFVLFGLSGEPFLELNPNTSQGKMKLQSDRSGAFKISSVMGANGATPESVRAEVSLMKADFNMRMKQAAFNSVCSSYYTTFVPLSFMTSSLYYEMSWVGRHVMLVWVGCFTMYLMQLFPNSYIHLLHKTAVCYLGFWSKVDPRLGLNFYHHWSNSLFWCRNIIVRSGKDLFRGEGIVNAADPGNTSHSRFSWLFRDISYPSLILLVIQAGLVLAHHISLFWSVYWYMLISEAILLFANYYGFFKAFRNYYVLSRVSGSEESFMKAIDEHGN